ncbi:amphi-Trp domain-containing protein [Streptomyces sp. NPDC006332]|uniref:amphi-Trp domain-containing protein n=1 Tax=Streptomyces sp. NPDC006332 TaxID=3155456 RepID=UPI0033A22BA5
MKDLKFEQKRSLSRFEAADQLTALATLLREGGDTDLELGPGTLSLRVPDELRGEIEVEVGDGQIELEIEFTWPTAPAERAASHTGAGTGTDKATRRKSVPAKSGRSGTGTRTGRSKGTKRTAAKTS